MAACSSEPPPGATKTVTVSSSATALRLSSTSVATPPPSLPEPAAGPRSALINVTLPAGTVPACCGSYPGMEVWTVPASYDYTVQMLRSQLPIFRNYESLPWCSQDLNGKIGLTQWDWADQRNVLVVAVTKSGTVTITRQPDDEGRQGCDPSTPTSPAGR